MFTHVWKLNVRATPVYWILKKLLFIIDFMFWYIIPAYGFFRIVNRLQYGFWKYLHADDTNIDPLYHLINLFN